MSDEARISEPSPPTLAIEICPAQRWEAFGRLRSLGITCDYHTGGPLAVCCDRPLAVIQCWCVLQQLTQTRAEAIDWLEACWHRSD